MRLLKRKNLMKSVGGAVMFQVLLGLGLMVMMSPMIFSQIKKYNESIANEEIVHELDVLQKAASSFIVFDGTAQMGGPSGGRAQEFPWTSANSFGAAKVSPSSSSSSSSPFWPSSRSSASAPTAISATSRRAR